MKRFLKAAGCMALLSASILLNACKKEDGLAEGAGRIVYAGGGNKAYNILSGGKVTLLRNTILSQQNTAFPVLLTRSSSLDVQVTARIDGSLLGLYDSLQNTESTPLPEGVFSLENKGAVSIKSGKTQSADSLRIEVSDPAKLPTGTTNFVIPVVLTTASAGVPVSTNRQVMFVNLQAVSIASGIAAIGGGESVSNVLEVVNGVTAGPSDAYFTAVLNHPVARPVTVGVVENPAAIAAYNTENGTDFKPFPAGSYQLVKTEATIKANESQSSDSIRVKLTNLSLFEVGTGYLLALKAVDSPTADMPPTDLNKNTVYVHVSVFVNNIDPTNSELAGTPIDRTPWTVTVSSQNHGLGTRMLDGDISTSWNTGSAATHEIKLDLGSTQTLRGFLLTPNYVYVTENITKMNLYSSRDGIIWKKEGTFNGDSNFGTRSNPIIRNVRFLEPVTARYFRFEIVESNGTRYSGLAELNAVK